MAYTRVGQSYNCLVSILLTSRSSIFKNPRSIIFNSTVFITSIPSALFIYSLALLFITLLCLLYLLSRCFLTVYLFCVYFIPLFILAVFLGVTPACGCGTPKGVGWGIEHRFGVAKGGHSRRERTFCCIYRLNVDLSDTLKAGQNPRKPHKINVCRVRGCPLAFLVYTILAYYLTTVRIVSASIPV